MKEVILCPMHGEIKGEQVFEQAGLPTCNTCLSECVVVLNYTPHTINMYEKNGQLIEWSLESSGVARCSVQETEVKDGFGLFFETSYGEVEGLPEQKPGTLLIVSGLVRSASERKDLVSPTKLVRDDKNRIIGCKGFSMN